MDTNQALLEAQRMATFGTLIAALIGGTIGFLGSWIATTINAKAERRKLLLQLGFEMGMKQYDRLFEVTEKHGGKISPPYIYVHHNVGVLELLADGRLTPEALEKLDLENKKILERLKSRGNDGQA